eukprot:928077-Pleurochrysis_carterae.AAC.2
MESAICPHAALSSQTVLSTPLHDIHAPTARDEAFSCSSSLVCRSNNVPCQTPATPFSCQAPPRLLLAPDSLGPLAPSTPACCRR